MTVKLPLRACETGDRSGVDLALRLAPTPGVAAVAHPPAVREQAPPRPPDHAARRDLVADLDRAGTRVPVIVSGGLRTAEQARDAYASRAPTR